MNNNLITGHDRYYRQILVKEIGGQGQQKLKKSKVLVIGAGGLGAPVLFYLAASGVGTLGVVDHDTCTRARTTDDHQANGRDLVTPVVSEWADDIDVAALGGATCVIIRTESAIPHIDMGQRGVLDEMIPIFSIHRYLDECLIGWDKCRPEFVAAVVVSGRDGIQYPVSIGRGDPCFARGGQVPILESEIHILASSCID